MANTINLSSSSSFSSTKSSSSSSKENNPTQKNSKRVVMILQNDNNKKFKEIKPKLNTYRHSMSFPSSTFQSNKIHLNHEDENRNSAPTSPDDIIDQSNQSFMCSDNDQITSGVVKNLRKKFLPDTVNINELPSNSTISRRRSKSELVTNFQLKKCQSVLLNSEFDKQENFSSKKLDEKISDLPLKKTRSNNFLNEIGDSDSKAEDRSLKIEAKDKINELSVFENVHIKDKISKFSLNVQPNTLIRLKKSSNYVQNQPHNPIRYGGSCHNLAPQVTLKSTNLKNQNRSEYSSQHVLSLNVKNSLCDTDVSNDESCSDELTNSSISDNVEETHDNAQSNYVENKMNIQRYKSELNIKNNHLADRTNVQDYANMFEEDLNKTKNGNGFDKIIKVNKTHIKRIGSMNSFNKGNIIDVLQINPVKFEEDYKKIKNAFAELKKDNEQIENILTDMRTKVKETTISLVDNYIAQNCFEQNNLESNLASIFLRDATNCPENIENIQEEAHDNELIDTKQFTNDKKFKKGPLNNKFSTQMIGNDNIQLIRHKF